MIRGRLLAIGLVAALALDPVDRRPGVSA